MRHATILAMLGLVSLTGAACGPQGSAPTPASPASATRPALPAEDPANRAARAKLQENRPKLEFANVRLDSVIDFFRLRDVTGLNLVVNWQALQAAGIDKRTTVTLTLSDVSNERALKEILSAAGGVVPLGYILDKGIVRISTMADLNTITTTRVYDVADLVAADTGQRIQEKTQTLRAVIRRVIDNASWMEDGGVVGRLCESDGLFVVLHTDQNHAQLAELLSKVRRKLDERTARAKVKTGPGAPPLRPAAAEPESEANRHVRAKLKEIQSKIDFEDASLDNSLAYFRDTTGLNLVVNWSALGAAGIDKGAKVRLTLSNVSREQVLKEILTVSCGVVPVGYILRDGVVRISTREDLCDTTIIRVYDVADLVAADPGQSRQERAEELSAARRGIVDIESWLATGDAGQTRHEKVQELSDIIRGVIHTESWVENGGMVGNLAEFEGLFLVSQTPQNHAQLAELLTTIRRKLDERTTRPADPAAAVDAP